MPLNSRQTKKPPFYRFKNKKLEELNEMQLLHWNLADRYPNEFHKVSNQDGTFSLLRISFATKGRK